MKSIIPFIVIAIIMLSFSSCEENNDIAYLVEETGYFHFSQKDGSCKYIDQAKERGYSIKEIKLSSAAYYKYKICRECFSHKDIESYNEKLDSIAKAAEEEREKTKIQNREKEIRDSIIDNLSDDVKEAIIEEYIENQREESYDYYPDEEPHGRYY